MLTSVLVPCWNALDLTRISLEQLLRWTTSPFEVVAVDNGSTDGTWSWLRSWKRGAASPALRRVTLARHGANRGYAGGMNAALALARGELVVFANADAAPGPLWLERMSELFAERPRLGGLAPTSNPQLGRSPRRPWAAPPLYDDLDGMARLGAAWALGRQDAFVPAKGFVPGFWFMARRAEVRRLGGFDESFFPGGYEDADLQWRLRKAGWELGYAGRAFVHHAWFGVARRNGLREARFYKPRERQFFAKNPDARGLHMRLWTPALGGARR